MTVLKLPRLPAGWEKQPLLFSRYWDSVLTILETNLSNILSIPDIQVALDAATAAAANANTAAANAQTSADDAASVAALTNSGTSGVSITATDAGSSVSLAITSHIRLYGDGTSVSVSGGLLTGLAYSTTYYVFYDQPSRAGGLVTYQTTTVKADAAQVSNRHLVGVVTTPATAGPDKTGAYVEPSGLSSIRY